MIRKLGINEIRDICRLDPVRPWIAPEWRVDNYLKGVYKFEEDNKEAYICYALCHTIPQSEMDLYNFSARIENIESSLAGDGNPDALYQVAVFYTVWSNDGVGWKIIKQVPKAIRDEHPLVKQFVTLSPLTPMATNFHMRNGAKCLHIGLTCQNFEYKIND